MTPNICSRGVIPASGARAEWRTSRLRLLREPFLRPAPSRLPPLPSPVLGFVLDREADFLVFLRTTIAVDLSGPGSSGSWANCPGWESGSVWDVTRCLRRCSARQRNGNHLWFGSWDRGISLCLPYLRSPLVPVRGSCIVQPVRTLYMTLSVVCKCSTRGIFLRSRWR